MSTLESGSELTLSVPVPDTAGASGFFGGGSAAFGSGGGAGVGAFGSTLFGSAGLGSATFGSATLGSTGGGGSAPGFCSSMRIAASGLPSSKPRSRANGSRPFFDATRRQPSATSTSTATGHGPSSVRADFSPLSLRNMRTSAPLVASVIVARPLRTLRRTSPRSRTWPPTTSTVRSRV